MSLFLCSKLFDNAFDLRKENKVINKHGLRPCIEKERERERVAVIIERA